MSFRLTPDMHLAFPGERAIVLDVAADRYFRLGPRASEAARREAAGIRLADPGWAPLARAALDGPPGRPGLGDSVIVWRWLTQVHAELRAGGLKYELGRARVRAARVRRRSPDEAAGLARAFAAARAYHPTQPTCLHDALALHAWVSMRGVACDLVIGVRDTPFVAHSWVEAHPLLLTDTLDMVAGLTPILRL